MTLLTGGNFVLRSKSTDPTSGKMAKRGQSKNAWAHRLLGLFGRRKEVDDGKTLSGDWLFAQADNAQIDDRSDLDPEWLPKDLSQWRQEPDSTPNGQLRRTPPPSTYPDGPEASNGAAINVRGAAEGSLLVQSLSKTFKQRQIIKDVSLTVRRGEVVGLLGPNGAGKTTLFYMITGLVRPDSGLIMLDDYDVTNLPMYRRARLGIGYLPQEPSIFRGLSVEDNIRAVLEITQPDKQKRAEELEGLLQEFDIARLRKVPAIALSGGERRRCEIARALAGHPSFMLLDEPFAGIDPIAIGDIRALVQHLKQRGIGVLVTDHNVRETLDIIDRAYIVHAGHVLTEGTPEEIVADPEVRRFYLGQGFRL